MLESVTAAMARIQEIKSHFRQGMAGGTVGIAPHMAGGPLSAPTASGGSTFVKPFFPNYLVKEVKDKVKGSVEAVSSFDDTIDSAAAKHGVDSSLLKAVIQAESGFNPNAVSSAGAQGLMQLMPRTAAGLGVSDPFDPEQNIDAGARYLKGQIDRFGSVEKALAAYNAGPAAVVKYGGVPPFRETQNYVNKVLSYRDAYGPR